MEEFSTTQASAESYLKNRLDEQIRWYQYKAAYSRKQYNFYTLMEIALLGLTPLLILYPNVYLTPYAALSSIFAIIIKVYLLLNDYKNNWISYRILAEKLMREKLLYQNKSGRYANILNEQGQFKMLVMTAESIISGDELSTQVLSTQLNNS